MALVIQSSVIPHKLYGYCLLISLWKNVIGGWQNDTRGQSVYHPGQWRKSETSSLGCMERTKSWKFFWSPHMQLTNTYIYMNMHTPHAANKKILRFFFIRDCIKSILHLPVTHICETKALPLCYIHNLLYLLCIFNTLYLSVFTLYFKILPN